jgi:MarR family transcriptional regulator, lower aerobic nicotinate degradation pathway regulator
MTALARKGAAGSDAPYILDDQVGFILRQAQQRHTNIFASLMIEELTPTQWAVIAKLRECGPCSQNLLGRQTAMDAATIKGVIDRLTKRGFTATAADPADGRRLLVALTDEGAAVFARGAPIAARITAATLEPLSEKERETFVALLRRLG